MNNLLPINQFIDLGRKSGAGFGEGDPKIHLAYLTKLGILPQSVKRKIDGEMTGCYPESCINTLLKVEQMKNKGMTYSQIAKTLNLNTSLSFRTAQSTDPESIYIDSGSSAGMTHMPKLISNPSFLYLIIGLLFGFLLSTLNSQGLAQMQKQANITATQPTSAGSVSVGSLPDRQAGVPQSVGSVYVISVPKQNLDKLDKTNINYLISN